MRIVELQDPWTTFLPPNPQVRMAAGEMDGQEEEEADPNELPPHMMPETSLSAGLAPDPYLYANHEFNVCPFVPVPIPTHTQFRRRNSIRPN